MRTALTALTALVALAAGGSASAYQFTPAGKYQAFGRVAFYGPAPHASCIGNWNITVNAKGDARITGASFPTCPTVSLTGLPWELRATTTTRARIVNPTFVFGATTLGPQDIHLRVFGGDDYDFEPPARYSNGYRVLGFFVLTGVSIVP